MSVELRKQIDEISDLLVDVDEPTKREVGEILRSARRFARYLELLETWRAVANRISDLAGQGRCRG